MTESELEENNSTQFRILRDIAMTLEGLNRGDRTTVELQICKIIIDAGLMEYSEGKITSLLSH